jgi:GTPase Era involved in 16S rRNA processing
MVKTATEIFNSIREQVEQISADWESFAAKVGAELPASYQAELQQLATDLTHAKDILCDELAHPTLILATTGTTSSGKSTLVNLLCGAEILPVAVQEMSAGVVTVEYSETPALAIHDTPGAIWECGKWENLSDGDIYDRVDRLMKTYLQSKEDEQTGVACPQSTIYYPFRLVKESNLLDLPPGTTVKIMDLPGLAYVGDEGNAAVIRNSRDALCLVTYNSAETDRKKTAELLDEVVEQVKELGGSPARMLFVLNKIDLFRDDKDWPESEDRFVQRTAKDIKAKLAECLPEYKDEIEDIQIVKLSAKPALLSLGMKSDRNAAVKLFRNFNWLIPEDIAYDVGGFQNWTEHDCKRVADAVWETTHADRFHHYLSNHIQTNFPHLVIPQAVSKLKNDVGYRLKEWGTQTTRAFINVSENSYKQEREILKEIQFKLKDFTKNRANNLREPFDQVSSILNNLDYNSNPLTQIEATINKFAVSYNDRDVFHRLAPIYNWRREVAQGLEKILSPVLDSLEKGKISLNSQIFRDANQSHVIALKKSLEELIAINYKNKAGTKIEARTFEEKKELQLLNGRLNELTKILKLIINNVIGGILNREMLRIQYGLNHIFYLHLDSFKTGVEKIMPDLGLNFSEHKFVKLSFQEKVNFSFEAGFPVTIGTWEQQKRVKTGTKRDLFTLFLFERDIYETKIEKLSSENANIPSIDDLARGWRLQQERCQIEVFKQVIPWIQKQIAQFNEGIDCFQSSTIDRYKSRLTQAKEKNYLSYNEKQKIWKSLQTDAKEFADNLNRLGENSD